MKVEINIVTDDEELPHEGFFLRLMSKPKTRKRWIVRANIGLSEEERAILTEHKLWDEVLFKIDLGSGWQAGLSSKDHQYIGHIKALNYSIKDLFKYDPFQIVHYDPSSATNFANELQTEILPRLKGFITHASEPPKSRSFEL